MCSKPISTVCKASCSVAGWTWLLKCVSVCGRTGRSVIMVGAFYARQAEAWIMVRVNGRLDMGTSCCQNHDQAQVHPRLCYLLLLATAAWHPSFSVFTDATRKSWSDR